MTLSHQKAVLDSGVLPRSLGRLGGQRHRQSDPAGSLSKRSGGMMGWWDGSSATDETLKSTRPGAICCACFVCLVISATHLAEVVILLPFSLPVAWSAAEKNEVQHDATGHLNTGRLWVAAAQ